MPSATAATFTGSYTDYFLNFKMDYPSIDIPVFGVLTPTGTIHLSLDTTKTSTYTYDFDNMRASMRLNLLAEFDL